MPLFGRRKSAPDTSAAIQLDSTIDYAPPSLPPKRAKTRKSAGLQPVDEHGRATRYGSVPPLRRSYSDGSSRRPVSIGGDELQLAYGYMNVCTEVELDLQAVEEVVRLCGEQIKARGLDQPLLFSSRALDLSGDGTAALIRSFFADRRGWPHELQFANCHDLAAVVKWALGRITTPKGTHGFLSWEMYERWRAGEKEKGYPPRYISTHLFHHLPTSTAALLSALLDLLSSAAAYTVQNGTTPRRLSALFAPYVFGLPDDETFETTYNCFLRYGHALEHLLLSYIRGQKDVEGHLPTNLLKFIIEYPADLQINLNRPSPNAKLLTVARIRRAARFNSRDLIRSAGTWDVVRSRSWASIFPIRHLVQVDGSPAVAFSAQYKKLLNLKASGASQIDEDEGDHESAYKDAADKQWMAFKSVGFATADEGKLKFDLRESERTTRRKRHDTMDWTTFADMGFGGRETYVTDTDLLFDPKMANLVTSWPADRRDINARLRKTEKELPPFPYDITPAELNPVSIDEAFFETWCDVLVSSGWQRDEIKEANWALIQYRCRPKEGSIPTMPGGDGRTAERWFLIEELVPKEYLQSLHDGKAKAKSTKGISFLRSVRRKPKTSSGPGKTPQGISYSSLSASAPPSSLQPRSSPNLDESVFQPGTGGETKQIKISNGHGLRLTPGVTPALSRATTVNRASTSDDRHAPGELAIPEEPVPAVPTAYLNAPSVELPLPSPKSGKFMGHGIGGTLSSQRGDVSKPVPPSPTLSSAPSGTSDRTKPTNPTAALLHSFRRHSNLGGNARERKREARSGPQVADFDYETHSVSDLPEEADALSHAAREGHEDERWIDVVRSPRNSAPLPVPENEDIRYPTSMADLPPPIPGLRVRPPTASTEDSLPAPPTPQERISEEMPTDESPYDGVAEDEETNDHAVWRGSRADRSPESASLPPPPSDGASSRPSQDSMGAERELPAAPEREDAVSKAARLRAKYGGGSGADQRASNVSRLISLYAKREDGAQLTAASPA